MTNNITTTGALNLALNGKLDNIVQSSGGSIMLSNKVAEQQEENAESSELISTLPSSGNTIRTSGAEIELSGHYQASTGLSEAMDGLPGDNPKKTSVSYKDFSRVPAEKSHVTSSLVHQPSSTKEPTFPVKLNMILSNPEFHDIIAWLPHGRSWRILQQKAFEERVIPLYFRHGRYSSFARQVNGWGFRRVTHGSDYNSYYHEMFLRGMPHLCERMRRLTSKDAKKKGQEEQPAPDFYSLSRANPLPDPTSALEGKTATLSEHTAQDNLLDVEKALFEQRAGVANYLAGTSGAGASSAAAAAGFLTDQNYASLGPYGFAGGLPNEPSANLLFNASLMPGMATFGAGAGAPSGATMQQLQMLNASSQGAMAQLLAGISGNGMNRIHGSNMNNFGMGGANSFYQNPM